MSERAEWRRRCVAAEVALAHLQQEREGLIAITQRSPVLDFHTWLEAYAATFGPLTQDEYAIAQSAFYFAHPGRGPQSSLMASTPPTKPQEPQP